MLILRPSNSGLKRLINIQKCRSSTKLDHCALCTARLLLTALALPPDAPAASLVYRPYTNEKSPIFFSSFDF